jgi:AraC family transcriptional regulator, glycine betaine-responsive activator
MLADIWTVDANPLELDLLVLDGVSLMCLSACVEPLRAANRIIGHTAYTWRLLSPGGQAVITSSGITLKVDGRFTPDDVRNALWIVAAFGVPEQASPALLAKVGQVARRGVPLWGVESGGWVMALAGLLNGHRATVHWEDLEAFQARFPAVDVRSDRVVIDGPYVTAGGASPMLDLTLELIRTRQGLAVSIEVASIFIYDQSKASGDPQPRLTLGRVEQRDARVSRCLKLMGDHVERPLEIATLARRVGISSRMLERLFLRDLGQTPSLFYRDLRLNGARRLVIDTRKSLTEIAILTGFSSSSAFSRSFKERFGQSPKAARLAGSAERRTPS